MSDSFIPVQTLNMVRLIDPVVNKCSILIIFYFILSTGRKSTSVTRAKTQFVPLQYRLLLINGVNIPWNAYLSLQNQAGVKPERAEI